MSAKPSAQSPRVRTIPQILLLLKLLLKFHTSVPLILLCPLHSMRFPSSSSSNATSSETPLLIPWSKLILSSPGFPGSHPSRFTLPLPIESSRLGH